MPLIETACDLCGGDSYDLLYPSDIRDTDIDPSRYFSSSRTIAKHLDIVRCQECRLVRTNPRDDPGTLQEVYKQLQDRVYEGEEKNRLRTARAHLNFASRYVSPPGKLLDIGCSSGIFLCEAQRAGWRVSGIEPSQWAVRQAQQRCPQAEIIPASMDEAKFPNDSFELITLWDVLEHVGSPTLTLRKVYNWLRPNGWLVMNVPDIDSFPARFMGSRWVLLLREHLYYFSPKTLQMLLKKCGFHMQGKRSNLVWFSIENILTRLSQYPGFMGEVAVKMNQRGYFRRLSLKFPMGEMNVAAQKYMT